MNRQIKYICALFFGSLCAIVSADLLQLPDGFKLTVLTNNVPNARQMAESPSGILYVGTRDAGKVYAVIAAGDGSVPQVIVVDEGLTMPSGLALLNGDLYVGALNRILRYDDIENNFHKNPKPSVITDRLPDKRHHGWKYLSIGPDGYLYVPVGAPCNICFSDDERFASILRMDPSNGTTTVFAHGVRNSVGMSWHPITKQLWFSDNGGDMLGDDLPPEEINQVNQSGDHFGYPFIHAGAMKDPRLGHEYNASDFTSPEIKIQAHSAPLGLVFYDGNQFPRRYQNALFIAEHGSWNRSSKVGYQVSVVLANQNTAMPFISGWLQDEKVFGRPSDLIVSSDGSLLIADDLAGSIYKVSYSLKKDE